MIARKVKKQDGHENRDREDAEIGQGEGAVHSVMYTIGMAPCQFDRCDACLCRGGVV